MNEAMIKVKSELGSDAVILNKRKIKQPGIFGFLKKKVVEVVAAIDEDYKIDTKYSKKSKIEQKLKEEKPKEISKEIPNKNSVELTDDKIDQLTKLVLNLENKINQMEGKTQVVTEKEEDKFNQYIKMLVS